MSENLSLSRAFLEPSDGGASHRQSDTGWCYCQVSVRQADG